MTPYVTSEECEAHRKSICDKIADECDGVKEVFHSELNLHDAQAKQIVIDVKRVEDTLKQTADIVKETAMLQKSAEEREQKNDQIRLEREIKQQELLWKLVYRLVAIGGVIVLTFFGIKVGEMMGLISAVGI